jgi:hypothetical protein
MSRVDLCRIALEENVFRALMIATDDVDFSTSPLFVDISGRDLALLESNAADFRLSA